MYPYLKILGVRSTEYGSYKETVLYRTNPDTRNRTNPYQFRTETVLKPYSLYKVKWFKGSNASRRPCMLFSARLGRLNSAREPRKESIE